MLLTAPMLALWAHKGRSLLRVHMSPHLSKFAQSVRGSTVVGMRRRADALEAKGETIIDFGIGEPDFDVPEPVKAAAIKAIQDGRSRYVDPRGLAELRELIARFEAEHHGVAVDADQIVVTPGSYGALSLLTRAILEPGDEVLVMEPCWGPYRGLVLLTGATPVAVPMSTSQGRFVIDAERLSAAVTPRTRAIILNTPWNPTGRVLSPAELTGVAAVAQRHDLWIIADEVYSELVFGDVKHVSAASLEPEVAKRTVIATSLSKAYAMTGWRLGYCVAPPELASVLGRLNQYATRCATSLVQYAAVAAFTDGAPFVEVMRQEYSSRRDVMVAGMNQIAGVLCPPPEGTFYAFPQMPETWGDSRDIAEFLLNEAGVIVTPGSAYGDSSRHHLRLSFATSTTAIEEGLSRLQAALAGYDVGG